MIWHSYLKIIELKLCLRTKLAWLLLSNTLSLEKNCFPIYFPCEAEAEAEAGSSNVLVTGQFLDFYSEPTQ
jgi:hypothetical protein